MIIIITLLITPDNDNDADHDKHDNIDDATMSRRFLIGV